MTTTTQRRGRPPRAIGMTYAPLEDDQAETLAAEVQDSMDGAADTQSATARDEGSAGADGGSPVVPDEPMALADGWAAIDSAPQFGRPCIVAGIVAPCIPLTTPAYLHHSRRWTGSVGRFTPFEEWRILNTPHKVPFEPLAWMRYE